MSAGLSLRAVKHGDDLGRAFGERTQRFEDWPPIGERSFVESYLKLDIDVCLRIGGNTKQWGAIFHFAGIEHFGRGEGTPPKKSYRSMMGRDSDQAAVLTHNVKLVQGVETVIPVHSLVRFEVLDSAAVGLGKPRYFFDSSVLRVDEIEIARGDREVDIFWPYVAVSLGQSDGEKVETTADHVEDRASLSIDDERQRLPHPELNDLISGVTIWLSDRAIWAVAAPIDNPMLQNLDLGYGPIDALLST